MSRPSDVLDRTALAPDAFAERVMAAVRRERPPTPTRAFVAAVRARSASDAGSALWAAWHLGTVRGWRIPPRVRARSLALLLAVVSALGTGSLATATAVRVAAEPVVQLFRSNVDEHGPVQNRPLDVDNAGPADDQPAGDGVQDDGEQAQPDRDVPSGGAVGAHHQPGGDEGNDEAGTAGADDEDTETNESGGDEENEDDAATDPADPDDEATESADDPEADIEETEASAEADDAEDADAGSADDEPDADEPDGDGADGDDDGAGGDPTP